MNKQKEIISILLVTGILFSMIALVFKTEQPVTDILLSVIAVTLFYKFVIKDN